MASAIAAVVEASLEPRPIGVFIRPSINLKSKGGAKVAILTTEELDALTVDPDTVCLSVLPEPGVGDCTRNHKNSHDPEDADGDGELDLVLHFSPRDAGLQPNTQVCLTGTTFDGINVAGCRTGIRVFSPGKKSKK